MNARTLHATPIHAAQYLIGARHTAFRVPRACYVVGSLHACGLTTAAPSPPPDAIPLRKHLKDEAKRKKSGAKTVGAQKRQHSDPRLDRWELTVGIEIHAELNTARKLFSPATTASAAGSSTPNSHVALFDAAMPGSQPQFQRETLLPALRAAIALGCQVQRKSGWDRKHYFHWDQPGGYQITQYYQPFAKDGQLTLRVEDGVPAHELHGGDSLRIGIKQVQMEQDTAKTTHVGASSYHVDLNRAGHPLIEIITLPHIHSPQTAAATVRKIQVLLKTVDACVTGMELGGLRADVNVSVRQRGTLGVSSYSGVTGLGQRTEIKNLSSFKAVEDAVVAERDRQIKLLEAGGVIEGETRGWTLGATETSRLRSKEGEVDYRYIPDADLHPLMIGNDLVKHLRETLPELSDETVRRIQETYGLSKKDAGTLISLDDGDRLEFMEATVDLLVTRLGSGNPERSSIGKMVGNWVLHELGGLLTSTGTSWSQSSTSPSELSGVLFDLHQKHITGRVAKQLLATLHNLPLSSITPRPTVEQLIQDGNLRLRPLSEAAYINLAQSIMDENPEAVAAVRERGKQGKVMWFVGQMIRRGEEGSVEAQRAKEVVERLLLQA